MSDNRNRKFDIDTVKHSKVDMTELAFKLCKEKNLHDLKAVLPYVIDHSAYLSEVGTDSPTLLHYAAANNWPKIVKKLIKRFNVDVNVTDSRLGSRGHTALHNAAWRDSFDAFEELRKHGADLTAVCQAGMTPLHVSCMYRSFKITEAILDATNRTLGSAFKGYIDAKDGYGITALDRALESSHTSSVLALVLVGASSAYDLDYHPSRENDSSLLDIVKTGPAHPKVRVYAEEKFHVSLL
jgi:ankyrin repeat protein